MGSDVDNIPASLIDKVEVITAPSAKYDPEGMAGIINIVLKENKFAGLNGNINTGGDSQGGSNLSGQVNYRTTAFNSYINLGMNDRKRISDGTSIRTMQFPGFKNTLDKKSDSELQISSYRYLSTLSKLHIDYLLLKCIVSFGLLVVLITIPTFPV